MSVWVSSASATRLVLSCCFDSIGLRCETRGQIGTINCCCGVRCNRSGWSGRTPHVGSIEQSELHDVDDITSRVLRFGEGGVRGLRHSAHAAPSMGAHGHASPLRSVVPP